MRATSAGSIRAVAAGAVTASPVDWRAMETEVCGDFFDKLNGEVRETSHSKISANMNCKLKRVCCLNLCYVRSRPSLGTPFYSPTEISNHGLDRVHKGLGRHCRHPSQCSTSLSLRLHRTCPHCRPTDPVAKKTPYSISNENLPPPWCN